MRSIFVSVGVGLVWLGLADAAKTQKPNIIHIVGDDIGSNDFNFTRGTNPYQIAPNLEHLAATGIVLDQFYTWKLCSPSRTMILTGRYTFRYGYYDNTDADGRNGGIMLNYTLTPSDLKRAGYKTHGVGKWHAGFRTKLQTPTYRGFDSYLGYYHAEENYFTQMFGGSTNPTDPMCENSTCCGVDFAQGDAAQEIGPSRMNGTYSTFVYVDRVRDIIKEHPAETPLFMYLPFQNVHGPTEAPQRFHDMYAHLAGSQPQYRLNIMACLSALDEGVGNVTSALKNAGLWDNTVIVFQSDNGGDTGANGQGMNNWPLRGTKWTHWEGGVNVVAFISGPLVPIAARGTHYNGMLHSTDWRVTFAGLAQIDPDNTGPFPLDGHDVWQAVTTNGPSPRNEVVHQVLKSPIVNQSCHPDNMILKSGHVTHCGASIRVGQWKLMLGYPGWPDLAFPLPTSTTPNVTEPRLDPTDPAVWNSLKCSEGCLFNLETDRQETNNLYSTQPQVVQQLTARLSELAKQSLPARNPPPYVVPTTPADVADRQAMCRAVEAKGYWVPWQDAGTA